ncbi:MAG: Bug family tripartite tricarboxylate transporter substrate binding protein [Casimicrobiaceae bacterium]
MLCRLRAALTFTVVLLFSISALAQEPSKGPVRLLVGFAPGGSSDLAARIIADKLKDVLGVPVLVDNKAGAGGRIAAEALKNAPPDGNTLLLTPIVVPVLAPLLFSNLPYAADKDFAPVMHVANYQLALSAGSNPPAKTLAELTTWLKANPSKASFGSPAPGSLPHFFGLMVGRSIGVDIQHIAYKGGAPLHTDLIGGQIPVAIDALSDCIEQHRGGRLRILATSGSTRSPLLPDVPTFKELGYPIEGNGWTAIYAPGGTPKPTIERLNRALTDVLKQSEVRQKLTHLGFEITGTSPEELTAIMRADTAKWKPIIQASGFKAD